MNAARSNACRSMFCARSLVALLLVLTQAAEKQLNDFGGSRARWWDVLDYPKVAMTVSCTEALVRNRSATTLSNVPFAIKRYTETMRS